MSGPAFEKANRAIERHVALQRGLQKLGYGAPSAAIDGVYGPGTRAAIAAWQKASGRTPTGFIGDDDASAIERGLLLPPEPSLNLAQPAPNLPLSAATLPKVTPPPSTQWSSNTQSLVITIAIVFGFVIFYKIYRRRTLITRVNFTVYSAVQRHRRALIRKRFQTLRHDDYGNLIVEPWQKEISYFIEKVIDPEIEQMGPQEYAFCKTMRPEISLKIEELIEQQAGASESFTLGPNLSPTDYEQYCAEQLRSAGWSADTTKASGDQGSDIIAEKRNLRLVVQCKLYNHPVGNKAVQEVAAARAHEQADKAVVVSNYRYTYSAQQLADTNEVLLLHHSDLRNIDDLLSAG
jgi:restriction system protein